MKSRKFVSNELLASIDVLNTINGGISEPRLSLTQFENHREIRARVPGVNQENLRAEIHNNILSVLYTFRAQTDRLAMDVPKVIHFEPVPYFVDVDKITAEFEDGFLKVTMPFNSLAQGYHRQLSRGN